MDKQVEDVKLFSSKLSKAGKRIFDLELEILKLRAELEVEKRYTKCLEHALDKQIKISIKGEQ